MNTAGVGVDVGVCRVDGSAARGRDSDRDDDDDDDRMADTDDDDDASPPRQSAPERSRPVVTVVPVQPVAPPAPARDPVPPTRQPRLIGSDVPVDTSNTLDLNRFGSNTTVVRKNVAEPNATVAPKDAAAPQPTDTAPPKQEAMLPYWVPSFQNLPSPTRRTKQEAASADATVKNCIAVSQTGRWDFLVTNQCPFPVRFNVESTNLDHSRVSERRYLGGAGEFGNISSYHEPPTVSGLN